MLDIIIKPSRCLDIEYLAVLHRARSLGYTLPTPSQQKFQNQRLLRELKYAGAWQKLDIFYGLANNGSKEFATIDWVTPSAHQITIVNSCTWASNVGFTGNGTDMYLDTNYNPSSMGVQYTLDNASRFAWVLADNSGNLDGVAASGVNTMIPSSSTSQRINQGAANLSSAADLNGTGLTVINRTSSTNVELFKNTTQISRTATSTSVNNANQLILRSSTTYGSHTISAYGMGASLVNENAALYNALNTYLASL